MGRAAARPGPSWERSDVRTTEERQVRLCIDVDPALRRRLRYAALEADMTLREYLTALLEERLAEPVEASSDSGTERG